MYSTPILSVDDALARNTQIGILLGLKLAIRLPYILHNRKVEDFQQLIEEMQNEQSNTEQP